jgi:hypothetical protein
MMAKQAEGRHASAAEVSEALNEWLVENGGDQWAKIRAESGSASDMAPGSTRRPGSSAMARDAIKQAPATAPRAREKTPAPAKRSETEDAALGDFLSHLANDPASGSSKIRGRSPKPGDSQRIPAPPKPASRPQRTAVAVAQPAPAVEEAADEVPVVEALVVEPSDSGSDLASPGSSIVRKRGAAGSQQKLLMAAAGGVVGLLLLIGAIAILTGGEEDAAAPRQDGVVDGADSPGPVPPPKPQRPTPASPAEVAVGPEGNFATIDEALAYVRDNAPLTDFDEPRLIRVAGGASYGPIVIEDHLFGALHIKSEGDQPAVLSSDDAGPLLSIIDSERVKIEGFRIDAKDKQIAVQLSGLFKGAQLQNLRIEGFAGIGIDADRSKGLGRTRLELTNLVLSTSNSEAVGIAFSDPTGITAVTLSHVVCAGPMQTGFRFESTLRDVQVRNCRFHDLQTAIAFPGGEWELSNVALENNTFHRVARGIAMPQLPAPSERLTITKNLFAEITGPELDFGGKSETPKLEELGSGGNIAFNWTARPEDAVKTTSAILFEKQGKTGIGAVTFASTDPTAANFLKPQRGDLSVQGAPGKEKYIGAVAP